MPDSTHAERIAKLEADNVTAKRLLIEINTTIKDGFKQLKEEMRREHTEDVLALKLHITTLEDNLKKKIESNEKKHEQLDTVRFFANNPKLLVGSIVGFLCMYLFSFQEVRHALIGLL